MAANDKKTQEWLDTALDKDMITRCKLLWTNGKPLCDTILNVIGKNGEVEGSFHVHKLILALGSRKFTNDLYETSPDEIPLNVTVTNFPTSMMELVLEFIYTDAIKRSLEWPEVGGLMCFSKDYGIPRLLKYCTDEFEQTIGQRCEKVLELFWTFISTSEEQYKWPKEYYKEIVKLCFSYILRNGDVILRSSAFRNKLSIENVELFIGSDYFCIPNEVLIFRGLQKWARAQCRKTGLDQYLIENIKNMLRKPDEDKESIGLLKYVRFPVFSKDDFHSVTLSSDRIIPKNVEELVHRYYVSGEPTGIFSEKRRPVEVDEEDEDFLEHIDQLVCNVPAFATLPKDGTESNNNSYLPSLEDDPLPMSPQPENGKQLNVIKHIKQEVDTKAQSYITRIPDHISIGSVGTSTTQNSPGSSRSSTPLRPMNQKGSTLKRTGNKAELTDTTKVSPIKLMKIKKEPEDETTPHKICDLKLSVVNRTSTESQNDEPVLKNIMIHTRKVKYSGIVKECSKKSDIVQFSANNLEIVDIKEKPKFQSVCMPQLKSFSVEVTLDRKTEGNLVKHLANINLEDFIFFYHDDSDRKNRLGQIWGKQIKSTLKLSEVTVFHAHVRRDNSGNLVGELTLNYTKKSSFFSLNGQGVFNGMNVLNLGNCSINQKCWLQNEIAEKLVELRLFRVKDLDLKVILGQCKSLEVLFVWAVENRVPTICLNDIASKTLSRLSIIGYMITFDPDTDNSVFPKCIELCLVNHSCDPVFTDMMTKTFPNLRRLSIYNETYPPEADFLLKITSGSSLEGIFVWNFENTSMDVEKISKLKSVIKNFDLIFKKGSSVENCSFQLERRKSKSIIWEVKNAKMKDLPRYVFESFGLDCFYTFEAFKKIVWTNYL